MATAVFILIAYLIGSLPFAVIVRSEEHTSELQSLRHLVCRLLLEKKKKQDNLIREEKIAKYLHSAWERHYTKSQSIIILMRATLAAPPARVTMERTIQVADTLHHS